MYLGDEGDGFVIDGQLHGKGTAAVPRAADIGEEHIYQLKLAQFKKVEGKFEEESRPQFLFQLAQLVNAGGDCAVGHDGDIMTILQHPRSQIHGIGGQQRLTQPADGHVAHAAQPLSGQRPLNVLRGVVQLTQFSLKAVFLADIAVVTLKITACHREDKID